MEEKLFVEKIRGGGGRVFIVGGWVRDMVREAEPKDCDYAVTGLSDEKLSALFPRAERVGNSFPVFLIEIDGEKREVAMARRERKISAGYKGFEITADEYTTIEEDLYRRDTTMNAMALELPDKNLIDPYNGRADIAAKKIRAVSHHFSEDPVRALRAARQAASFGFDVDDETIALMRNLKEELKEEPSERILGELKRALATDKPSVFFRVLQKAELLEVTFPEIFALIGKTQPEFYHPEGDAFEHTMNVLDEVAAKCDDAVVRFAALVHDLGKGTTPQEMLPHHYDHETRGVDELFKWTQRCTLPTKWLKCAEFVISEHMRAARLTKPGKIVDLLLGINRLGEKGSDVIKIFETDNKSLPDYLARYDELVAELLTVRGNAVPDNLRGVEIGEWIRSERIRKLRALLHKKE